MPKKKLTYPEIFQLTETIHDYGINPYSREIYLTNLIEENIADSEINHNVSSNFIKNFKILEYMGRSKITIHMNVLGGSFDFGMGIFDCIKSSSIHTTIIAYSAASSMSGIVLQAADKRIMTKNSHFLMHHGNFGIEATSQQAIAAAKFNEYECNKMIEIFAERAVVGEYFREREYNVSKIKKYFKDTLQRKVDWYMTPGESLAFGLVDQVI